MTKITDLTGAAPDSADVIPYVDVSDTTEDAAGTAKKATAAQIVAAGNPGYLPKTAGSGQGVTGVLYLDPGADDIANVLKIPVTSADNSDFNMNVGIATFETVEDVIFNWGFNQTTGGGKEDSGEHAFWLQLENNYRFNGVDYVEYHLNLTPAASSNFRPFQFQYAKDGTSGIVIYRATTWQVYDHDGSVPVLSLSPDSGIDTSTLQVRGAVTIDIPDNNANAFILRSNGSASADARFTIDTTVNAMSFESRRTYFRNEAGTIVMTLDQAGAAPFVYIGDNAIGRLTVTPAATTQRGVVVKGMASQSGALFAASDSAGTYLCQVRANGTQSMASVADADAAFNSFYYSTDRSKLCYKDPGGTVNELY